LIGDVMARANDKRSGFGAALIGALALMLALLPSDGHAQVDPTLPPGPGPLDPTTPLTIHTYTARTTRTATKSVTAGAIRWDCRAKECTNQGPWTSLGIEACRSLARLVGPIEAFGRPGLQYTPAQITECNQPSITLSTRGVVAVVPRSCTSDADCDDGLFCNGTEQCGSDRRCLRAIPVDCDDRTACTIDQCSEEARACRHLAPDLDSDGHADRSCTLADGSVAGDDCDDTDPNAYPGATEICNAVDEDCNPETIGNKDSDNDGFIDANCSNGALAGEDCDDGRRRVNPQAGEICNGVDDDCSGTPDDNDAPKVTTWPDNDRDGYGNPAGPPEDICLIGSVLIGRSLNDYDCNDAEASRHPGTRCP
jgi:hypothetical protein